MIDASVPVHTSAFHNTRPSLARGINGWCIHVDPSPRGVLVAVHNDHLSPISSVLNKRSVVPLERNGLLRHLIGPYMDPLEDRIQQRIEECTTYILRLEGLARTLAEDRALATAEAAVRRVIDL